MSDADLPIPQNLANSLSLPVARNLAASLVSIGHPASPAVIDATALDLIKWCKGGVLIENRIQNAEQQARALIEEARFGWDEGWPQRGGTKKLYKLFREKYAPKSLAAKLEWSPLSYEETIAKGLIKPPCAICDDNLYLGTAPNLTYCLSCARGRANARWEGEAGLHRLNREGRPVGLRGFTTPNTVTPEDMAKAREAEEKRRRERDAKLRNEKPDEGGSTDDAT